MPLTLTFSNVNMLASANTTTARKKIMRHLNFFLMNRVHMWSFLERSIGCSSKKEWIISEVAIVVTFFSWYPPPYRTILKYWYSFGDQWKCASLAVKLNLRHCFFDSWKFFCCDAKMWGKKSYQQMKDDEESRREDERRERARREEEARRRWRINSIKRSPPRDFFLHTLNRCFYY